MKKLNTLDPDKESKLPHSSNYQGQAFDIMFHALMGKYFTRVSPMSIGLAMFDWLGHFALTPAKQMNHIYKAWQDCLLFPAKVYSGFENNHSLEESGRFKHPEWKIFPFNMYAHIFLLYEKWCNEGSSEIRGVSHHHEQVIHFMVRQVLDMLSPANFLLTNPEVLAATLNQGGKNLVTGLHNYFEDLNRIIQNQPPVGIEQFQVGKNLAITPGKVVYRNHLIELIQYEPITSDVYAEPILIIPAWIMKYYILDLSPHNSLVKYLVAQGHTVFMISWKNPDSDDRHLGFEDYINLGMMDALNVINQIIPNKKIHGVGYCLGGTLLMMTAAVMMRENDDRLKSLTLFAAQVDFHAPGDLSLFIDHSQVNYIEDIMWETGYLQGVQMAYAFNMLRSNDLVWSRMIQDYLFGKRRAVTDLLAWNSDVTRLPFHMHSEYLHKLFLHNDLIQGHFHVGKKKISLTDINLPIFVVSTVKDHVSPWRSVYKVQQFTNTDVTFVLTSGGHNAGIVSEPGHPKRHYQMQLRKQGDKYISPDAWINNAPNYKGSWWPAWANWLAEQSSQQKVPPPVMGVSKKVQKNLCAAPGTYIYQK